MAHVSNGAAADSGSLGLRMAELVSGYQVSAAIGALARLGVADALADGPLTVPALAARVGADPVALRRVLHTLSDVGLFESAGAENVALSPLGQLLRTDIAGSARRAAVAATEAWRWRAYGLRHAQFAYRRARLPCGPRLRPVGVPRPPPGGRGVVQRCDVEDLRRQRRAVGAVL